MIPTWRDIESWLGPGLRGKVPELPPPAPESLSTDTRALLVGEWFVPLVGASFDGHDFLDEALKRGAAGFFYEEGRAAKLECLRPEERALGVCVSDTLVAFQKIASGWRAMQKKVRLAALTGSSGKTTTKELLTEILSAAGPTLATHGSFNNEIGVPKTLLRLKPEHRFAALEFGARKAGDIKFLVEMVQPNVAAVLNVGNAHLGVFGSREALIATKTEMYRFAPVGATLIAPAEDAEVLAQAKKAGRDVLTFGRSLGDVRVTSESSDGVTTRLELLTPKGAFETVVPMAHSALAINAAAATAIALAAGASPENCAQGLARFKGVKGRYQVHQVGPCTVIDDAYNANPQSMEAGFRSLAASFPNRRKVLILGDMLELGETSRSAHEEVGRQAVTIARPELLLTVGKEGEAYAAGAVSAGLPRQSVRSYGSVQELLAEADRLAQEDWVIYVKGSNSIRLALMVEALLKGTG